MADEGRELDPAALAQALGEDMGVIGDEILVDGNRTFDEIMRWRRNAPLLYDIFLEFGMQSPALSVRWLADEADEECTRLAFGTQATNGESGSQSQIVVAELTCVADSELASDPWRSWGVEGLRDSCGFGARPLHNEGNEAPLRLLTRMAHDSDVNRLVSCPSKPQLLAAKGSSGVVTLFDYKRSEEGKERMGVKLGSFQYSAEAVDGFALAWSPLSASWLATGGNDGSLSFWDTEAPGKSAKPLFDTVAHDGPLNDLSFSKHSPQLTTVGEDCGIAIWDVREALSKSQLLAAGAECLTVDWSPSDQHLLATGGKDAMVNIWDLRAFKLPMRTLPGHKGEVLQIQWCPAVGAKFAEISASNLLATCSQDGDAIIWNLAPRPCDVGDEGDEDDQAPEVCFIHSGHRQGMLDFDWTSMEDLLMCSVGEDCTLQVWKPSLSVLEEDEEPEAEETEAERAAKRSRVD
ncbi:lin-53 [Symbiodinium natans]|uniref:Lin-53 protein n=1 Tax=Symbiodinium natans TaxID=878477 RepID=A0A812SM65_9DINO|nr:lin-53 [Symbiodinium natans]